MSIDAMKQALEALEMLKKWEHPASNITTKTGRIYPHHVAANAADALRLAIEQAERQEPVAWMDDYNACKCPDNEARCFSDRVFRMMQKYTAAPPQRQFDPSLGEPYKVHGGVKPLTEDEIAQLMFKCDVIVTGPTQFNFARAVEAAHGIK